VLSRRSIPYREPRPEGAPGFVSKGKAMRPLLRPSHLAKRKAKMAISCQVALYWTGTVPWCCTGQDPGTRGQSLGTLSSTCSCGGRHWPVGSTTHTALKHNLRQQENGWQRRCRHEHRRSAGESRQTRCGTNDYEGIDLLALYLDEARQYVL
jgi:hypothetical protein